MIALLASATFLLVVGFALAHFTRNLRDPRNKDAAKNTLVEDGSSAHTAVRGGNAPEHLR